MADAAAGPLRTATRGPQLIGHVGERCRADGDDHRGGHHPLARCQLDLESRCRPGDASDLRLFELGDFSSLKPSAVLDEVVHRNGDLGATFVEGLDAGSLAPVADPDLLMRGANARVSGRRLEEHADRHVLEPPGHRGAEGAMFDPARGQVCGGSKAVGPGTDHHRAHFLACWHRRRLVHPLPSRGNVRAPSKRVSPNGRESC